MFDLAESLEATDIPSDENDSLPLKPSLNHPNQSGFIIKTTDDSPTISNTLLLDLDYSGSLSYPRKKSIVKMQPKLVQSVQKWSKLNKVLLAIQNFKTTEVIQITTEKCLSDHFSNAPTPTTLASSNASPCRRIADSYENFDAKALKGFKKSDDFFACLNRASEEDYKYVEKKLQEDPKRFLFQKGHPERLSNKRNPDGQTPLYVVSKNGHLNMVKLLLEHEADPHALHKIGDSQFENILEVAVRWGHKLVVKYLLENVEWKQPVLIRCHKTADTKEIRKMLKSRISKGGLLSCWKAS